METVVYKEAGECAVRADVFPVEQAGAPVVVHIHGGALIIGHRGSMNGALRDRWARAGLAQVSIDYRLAPESKLPAIVEDVVDAFAWVRGAGAARYGWDGTRVAAVGRSAGGYLALMAGCRVAPPLRAIAAFYGYGNIVAPWYSQPDPHYLAQPAVSEAEARAAVGTAPLSESPFQTDRGRFYLYCRQQGLWPNEVCGVDLAVDPHALDAYCPALVAGPGYPPTLLLHGTADTDVPYAQSAEMAEALKRVGAAVELVTVPEGPHGFDGGVRPEHLQADSPSPAALAVRAAGDFMVRHLQDG